MICRNCGTEIADKALVCFRCGAATFEAKVKPGRPAPRRSQVPAILALIILLLAALFMSQAAAGQAPRLVSWVMAGLAVILLVWRLFQRRR
jgi:hypothetical protein